MIKRIDLFMPPRSQYGVLHHFTKKLYEAFNRIGVSCRILEAQRDNPRPFLEKIFADPPDCTLSFNGLLPDDEGRFFCDLVNIPHVAFLVDSPNHFFSLVKSPKTIITCVDKYSCDFFHGLKSQQVLFTPHGVEKELQAGNDAERNYDVVMLSSCIDFEAIRNSWKSKFSSALCKVMDEAAEKTLNEVDLSFVQAFVSTLDARCKNHGDIDPKKIDFIETFDLLEDYVKGKERFELLRSIKDARVDVFGSSTDDGGWSKYFGKKNSNIVIRDPVPYEQALEIMKQSKIVLNSCAWIKNGIHERILAAMLSGALTVVAENIYLRGNFRDGSELVFYKYSEMDQINEKINDYLAEEDKRRHVAAQGRQAVLKHHTWDHRASTLIQELEPLLKQLS